MANFTQFRKLMQQIQVVRPPKHRLSTFGVSQIHYHLVTDVPGLPDRSRLRIGQVTAERPQIITSKNLKERFEGFGAAAVDYAEWLATQYGEALRGLEYQFRNTPESSQIELTPPPILLRELTKEFDRGGGFRSALIRGTDKHWELSVMKFIIEETMTSFTSNIKELHERGFFDEGRDVKRQHAEIQLLIKKARADSSLIPALGKKLKESGFFDQYQDEFFQLIR
ncbi:MAG: hypothetical protein LHV69_08660 [Elusimicrobia bacterium]|nr:hypothetical protein [Candidatus Obscuribacterium magneticum]